MAESIDIHKILKEELGSLKEAIRANMESAGQMASGRTADSMEVETSDTSGALTADRHFPVLELGSKPWARQYKRAPRFFAEIISEWMTAKGLYGFSPYAVATTIMREGSKLYREGGRRDIYTDAIDECLSKIEERILGEFDLRIIQSIANHDN